MYIGEDFDGHLVNDGWTAYPAFTDAFQRCWAHTLREIEFLADRHPEAERIARMLHTLYGWLLDVLEADPSDETRERIREYAHSYLEDIVELDVDNDDVQQFLGKLEGGLGHWLVFVTNRAVHPTNNAAENALREPVVLRKIIGTVRTKSGEFVHETLLSLLATWEQQELNPYEQLKRVESPATA